MTQESPLGEALKTIYKKRKSQVEIRVCDNCGVPLLWTFAFAYNERYCLNCGAMGGMLGTGSDVVATKELILQGKMVNALWKIIYGKKGLIPKDAQRINCKKCDATSEKHYLHLTENEKEWDKVAREMLEQVKGIFDKKEIN